MTTQLLTIKQKKFCIGYTENGGNGAKAVIEAGYNVKGDKNLASVIASENLRKPNIQKYIKELFRAQGFDEVLVEKEHAYLIEQRDDLSVKAKAIELYYKITGRMGNDAGTNMQLNVELQVALDKIRNLIPD